MDKSVYIIFGDSFCYALSALDIDILQIEVPRFVRREYYKGWLGLTLLGNPGR